MAAKNSSKASSAINGSSSKPSQPGIPIDASGGPTVDPTKNVLDLVEAAVRRIDDLRGAESKRIDEVLALRTDHLDEITSLNAEHLKEIVSLRAEHSQDLMAAEAKRIDAIRVVDVQAVSTANEKATAQASVLATQVTASAETLRTLVASNATALAAQLTQIITPITDRLSLVEKAQYEGAGKQTVADPQLASLIAEVRNLTMSRDTGTGKGIGQNQIWVYFVAGIGVIGTIATLILFASGHVH